MSEAERLRVLAHELRAPVAALLALADGANGVQGADERRRLVTLAVAAGRDIERVLHDPELVSLRLETVDLGGLATAFETERVHVRVDGNPFAHADPTRLRQALANLVDNGLRHGARVVIDVATRDGEVVFDVSDDGPGIAAGIDPFARGTSTSGSSGLGLWLAREIAEAHGGTLDVVPGGPGARFRLALPLASGAR